MTFEERLTLVKHSEKLKRMIWSEHGPLSVKQTMYDDEAKIFDLLKLPSVEYKKIPLNEFVSSLANPITKGADVDNG